MLNAEILTIKKMIGSTLEGAGLNIPFMGHHVFIKREVSIQFIPKNKPNNRNKRLSNIKNKL